MTINQRVGVEFLSGTSSNCYHVSVLKVWALNHPLTKTVIDELIKLSNFGGKITIDKEWLERPDGDKCNWFHCYKVVVEVDSSG